MQLYVQLLIFQEIFHKPSIRVILCNKHNTKRETKHHDVTHSQLQLPRLSWLQVLLKAVGIDPVTGCTLYGCRSGSHMLFYYYFTHVSSPATAVENLEIFCPH